MLSLTTSLRPISQPAKIGVAALLLLAAAPLALAQYEHEYEWNEPFLPNPVRTVSTIPTTGDADLNPYGVTFIGEDFNHGTGPLRHGDILVSNYNGPQNLQGTGTSIIRVPAKTGAPTVFFRSTQAHTGLSTALGTLTKGLVVVGSLPTVDGTAATAQSGSLLVIDNQGNLLQAITDPNIQGPWDMTLIDGGDIAAIFVSNALNGSISRLIFRVSSTGLALQSSKVIATGFLHQSDPAALFDAPTGLVFDGSHDTLYVASTLDNAVFGIPDALFRSHDAGTGRLVYKDNVHLHGALAMAQASNGDLLVSNNDVINADANQPSEIVEFTRDGRFVKQLPVDPNLGGSFGLNVHTKRNGGATFAAVDDNALTLTIWQLAPR